MKQILIVFTLLSGTLMGQNFSGKVLNSSTNSPIEYVNIGIVGKNIGTTSDTDGNYTISIDKLFDNDSLLFSSIGYSSFLIKVEDFKKLENWTILLEEKVQNLDEVIVRPIDYKEKLLGVTTQSKRFMAGFEDKQLGYELGILMNVKKSAALKEVDINIAECTYDTIFYRLNIYRVANNKPVENILQKPIYLNLKRSQFNDKININLAPYNIIVEGDFLITLEHVKDLGPGKLLFCAGLSNKTHYRKTSQGEWETAPVGISLSVLADVEK